MHFRDPGYPHKEDWHTGTAAAAFGGVTTVFDMPNTVPSTGTAEALADKHRFAAAGAHVDFGLYGLLGEDTIAQVPALVEGGVIGFKLYMGRMTRRGPPLRKPALDLSDIVRSPLRQRQQVQEMLHPQGPGRRARPPCQSPGATRKAAAR